MLPNDNDVNSNRAVNNQDVIKMSDAHRNVVISNIFRLCKIRSFYVTRLPRWDSILRPHTRHCRCRNLRQNNDSTTKSDLLYLVQQGPLRWLTQYALRDGQTSINN